MGWPLLQPTRTSDLAEDMLSQEDLTDLTAFEEDEIPELCLDL